MRDVKALELAGAASRAKTLVDLAQDGYFLRAAWSYLPTNLLKNLAEILQSRCLASTHQSDVALNLDVGPVENVAVHVNCERAVWVTDPRIVGTERRNWADKDTATKAGGPD